MEYTLAQLYEGKIISKELKQILNIQGIKSSSEILNLAENEAQLRYLTSTKKGLADELLTLIKKLPTLELEAAPISFTSPIKPYAVIGMGGIPPKEPVTVGDYTFRYLKRKKKPIKFEDLVEKLKTIRPTTNYASVRANLNGDPQKRFVFFLDGYVGLEGINYGKAFIVDNIENKKQQYAQERILEFSIFIEENHRSPQPTGLPEEESLYRWYLYFMKSTAKELKDLKAQMRDILREYKQYVYTPQEYGYKNKCEQVKYYVDENVELPGPYDEPELSSWFNSQVTNHLKYKDKRKSLFCNLLEYLKDYGIHFVSASSSTPKSLLKVAEPEAQYGNNSELEKYKNLFTNLNTATIKGHKAPHKALLLLAIINLIEKGQIYNYEIKLNDTLLTEFADVCIEYVGTASSYVISMPFYHMNSEPFWTLVPKDGVSADEFVGSKSVSYRYLEEHVACAAIDQNLFNLLMTDASKQFKDLLVKKYIEPLQSQQD